MSKYFSPSIAMQLMLILNWIRSMRQFLPGIGLENKRISVAGMRYAASYGNENTQKVSRTEILRLAQ